MIYVWKLDKLIFPAWVSNICIKPWIGLQMFINCVCHNSVKPSKQASGRSILGRDTIWGGEGVREEKAGPGDALWWQIDTLFDLWGRQPPRLPTARGKERWSYLCFMSFSTEGAHFYYEVRETDTCHYWRILQLLSHTLRKTVKVRALEKTDDENGGRSENHRKRREAESRNWG